MSEVVDALLMEAFTARRENRPAYARRILLDALDLCRKSPDADRLPKALTALGQAERDLRHLDTARQYYEEAAAIYRASGRELRFAHTIRHVGDIHRNEGHHALAEPCYEEALRLYHKHPEAPPLDLANTLRGMAILKGDVGQTEQARMLWQEAGEIYEAVGVEAGATESRRRIAALSEK